MKRRKFLAGLALIPVGRVHAAGAPAYPAVVSGAVLAFPRDHGQHAAFRTEWWYVTAWVRERDGRTIGVQITFFRNRPGVAEGVPSRFAPTQLFFAHAAIADPALGRLRHDQRAAREGFGLAGAAEGTTNVFLGDWSLVLDGDTYRARIPAREFALDLSFKATQPILLQGEQGYSRKGPLPRQSSHYYSRPHLAVTGQIEIEGRQRSMTGIAWLDHEWSSEYLAPSAAGWDWIGINMDDGSAVMAFRVRDRAGDVLWAGGALRGGDGRVRTLARDEVRFSPARRWTSPRTGTEYPVEMAVSAGDVELVLAPLFDDQELDSRASTGTIYWEGAVTARSRGQVVGRGYLELTGYGEPLVL